MKKGVLTIVAFLMLLIVFGQNIDKKKLSPVSDAIVYVDIFFSDYNHGWVCGGGGTVMRTSDGGISWSSVGPFPSMDNSVALKKILFLKDNLTGWVIGKSGHIYRTLDGGTSWIKCSINTKDNIKDLSYSYETNKLAILSGYDEIFESFDKGETWKLVFTSKYETKGFAMIPMHYILYSASGGLYRYPGSGREYDDVGRDVEIGTDYSDVRFVKYNPTVKRTFGICDTGHVISDVNGRWQVIGKIPGATLTYSLCFNDKGNIFYALGDEGKVFKSVDGGITWDLVFNLRSYGFDLFKVICDGTGSEVWICGANRTLMHSTDSGKTWVFRTGNHNKWKYSPISEHENTTNSRIAETSFDSKKDILYCVGSSGMISSLDPRNYKFQRLTPREYSMDFFGMYFDAESDNIYAVGDGLAILRYSLIDKKTYVLSQSSESKIRLHSICFDSDNTVGMAVGMESTILITKNKGKSWQSLNGFQKDFSSFSEVVFNEGSFFVVGDKGRILKFDRNGENAQNLSIEDSTGNLVSVFFLKNSNLGFIASSNSSCKSLLYMTRDKGYHWSEVASFPKSNSTSLRDVNFNSKNSTLYVTDSYGSIYESIDTGKTWFTASPWMTYSSLNFISFDDNGSPIIGGDGGALLAGIVADTVPQIKNFKINYSTVLKSYVPEISLEDNGNKNITYSLSILEELMPGSDYLYKNQTVKIQESTKIRNYPSWIFEEGKLYTFRLTIFNGWNFITKDTVILIGETKFQKIARVLYWNNLPNDGKELLQAITLNTLVVAIIYAIIIFLIYAISPIHFILWHELVAMSKLPYADKISNFLALSLLTSDRCLDAFVDRYSQQFSSDFISHNEVASRPFWVAAPFKIDNRTIVSFSSEERDYTPGLSEIKSQAGNGRVIISIEGQGGVGKSSLAFQIAKWSTENNRFRWLTPHKAVVIFINKVEEDLDVICKRKIEYVLNVSTVSDSLMAALLEKKRILAVVDGISEMADLKPAFIDPEKGAKKLQAVIYTSRKAIVNQGVVKVFPIGLKLEYLDSLIDGFTNVYAGANRFGAHREVLRIKVKDILFGIAKQDRDIPLIILRFMIEKASELADSDRSLDELPNSLPALFENYVESLFRNYSNSKDLIKSLRKASIVYLGLNVYFFPNHKEYANKSIYKPQWVSEDILRRFIPNEYIQIFTAIGLFTTTGSVDDLQIKFSYDPIAEYLAAKEIYTFLRDGKVDIVQVDEILDKSKQENKNLYDFLSAFL